MESNSIISSFMLEKCISEADEVLESEVPSPGLLEDWWEGYPVWQEQREAAVPMVVVVTAAAVLGLAGNVVLAGLLCCRARRPRTPTGLYVIHRAITEVCAQVCQPFVVVTVMWDYPPGLCIFNPAMMQLGMAASTVFLAGLTLDSYLASRPLRFSIKTRWRLLKGSVTVAWVAGVVIFSLTGLGIFRQGDMCLEGPLFLIHTHGGVLFCLLVVLLLSLLVMVTSLFLLVAGRTRREAVTSVEGEEAAPPRRTRLLLALGLSFAVTRLPYWTLRIHYARVRELLSFPVHAVVISLAVVGMAVDPLLGMWFRAELWHGAGARLRSLPSTSSATESPPLPEVPLRPV